MLVLVRNPKGREVPERAMQGSSWLWAENTILQRPHFLWKNNEPERQSKNSMGKQQESKVYVLGEFWTLRLWSLCMDCSACHKWKPLGEDTFPYILGPNDSQVLTARSYNTYTYSPRPFISCILPNWSNYVYVFHLQHLWELGKLNRMVRGCFQHYCSNQWTPFGHHVDRKHKGNHLSDPIQILPTPCLILKGEHKLCNKMHQRSFNINCLMKYLKEVSL